LAASSLVVGHLPSARAASAFPDKPLRIIVGLPPGGSADVVARAVAAPLEKAIKQPVIVENRPGGQFQISMQALTSAPPDGHTLLYFYNGYSSIHVVQKLFDMDKQLIPITQTGSTPIVLLVRGDAPYRTLGELIAFGKANPGKLAYGTFGPGSVEHLKLAQFEKTAGFSGTAVPYRGGPDMLKAVIGGEIAFGMFAGIFAKQFGPSGQVRSLAVFEEKRWSDLPDVPTFREAGIDLSPLSYWGGFAVRTGTPPDIVQKLHKMLVAATIDPSAEEKIVASGAWVSVSPTPADFRAVIDSDIDWMTNVAKDLKLI